MKWLFSGVTWGLLLIAAGVIFLLENLGIITIGGLWWAVLIAFGGVAFITVFLSNRQHWWALIPGTILLSVGASILLGNAFPRLGDDWTGAIILAGIGLAFLFVYLANRSNWWAIIPMGVMGTLAIVTGVGERLPGTATGGLFLFGLGITFGLVAILPNPSGQLKWAFIPGGILMVIGLLLLSAMSNLLLYLGPVALILVGIFILTRNLRRSG